MYMENFSICDEISKKHIFLVYTRTMPAMVTMRSVATEVIQEVHLVCLVQRTQTLPNSGLPVIGLTYLLFYSYFLFLMY